LTTDLVIGETWTLLRRRVGRGEAMGFHFVDATAIMRRDRIREALAFDDDFTAAGFVEVRPSAAR
jgi:predicted nucleic acid-binding protein